MRRGFGVVPEWDEPQPKDIVIRQSTIESLSLCPARVGYMEQGLYDGTPSEPMAYGTLVHNIIERFLQEGKHLWHLHEIQEVFIKGLDDDGYAVTDLTNTYHVDNICLEARAAFDAWLRDWWNPIGSGRTPLAVEELRIKPIGMLSPTVAVWVQGTPDYVHTQGVDDWKTAGRGWNDNKGATRIQSPLYVFLEEDTFGDWPQVPFTYVIYNRAKRVWEPQVYEIDRQAIESAKSAAYEWAAMMQKKVFPPTPSSASGRPGRGWWCSATFCGAWNECEYKGMVADSVDLLTIRSSRWAA